MKFLLILCFILKATVSAKTSLLITADNITEKPEAVARFQVTEIGELNNYSQDIDYRIEKIFQTSDLIFSFTHLPHIFDSIKFFKSTEKIFLTRKTSYFSNRATETKYYITLAQKSVNEFYRDKSKIGTHISLRLSDDLQTIQNRAEQKTVDEKKFKYAGSTRFTLSGDLPNLSTEIKPMQASLALGFTAITGIALHINQSTAWWDGKDRSFYVKDDWDNALFADKFGHFMGGYYISYAAREAFVYSGFSWDQSILLGSLLGLIAQTYVEFKDGYAENTGFSPSDFAADFAGITYFCLQHYVPFLQNFSPKWQYSPPEMIGVCPEARTQTFLDNYNSTTAWISIHVRNLFCGEEKSIWPKWLNLGLGYGVSGYCTPDICSRYVIGIDYNLVELLPDGVPFWNWLKQSLNGIKFPAPAIEFSTHGTRFLLLYPFVITIGSVQL